ncbi:MAG: NgoFVII family restriction endonuclease [Clostridia bacterium]|nr:NgoFVII family restriction endonuclease [Clostridia bacterium]
MLYYDNLYEIVFHRHEHFACDEFIVISGYVGPQPVRRIKELPIKSTVVYGMYASDGIHKSLHASLLREEAALDNLTVLYSTMPVHTKAYMWLRNGKVVHSLIGSANFSMNGLTTPNKETLAETTADTFRPLEIYRDLVFGRSIPCINATVRQTTSQQEREASWVGYDPNVCELPLYLEENNERYIPPASGINWGMARLGGSHVNINDAYIPIPADRADHYPLMFPAKQTAPVNMEAVYREGHRHNDTVEVIWDDGKEMTVLLEGSRGRLDEYGNKVWYPKQIASSPSKAELGKYIRSRLNIPEGKAITYDDLIMYGRDSISISLQGEGIYFFDFSPRNALDSGSGRNYPPVVVTEPVKLIAEQNSEFSQEQVDVDNEIDDESTLSNNPASHSVLQVPASGERVVHKIYGTGIVKQVNDTYIVVSFGGTEKEFQIPNAFESGFLKRPE